MSDEKLLGAMFDARMRKIEQLEEENRDLRLEIERLKTEPRGDGYDCSGGCAHCCSVHRCDCYN